MAALWLQRPAALVAALLLAAALLAAPVAIAATTVPPVAVRLSGGVGPLGGYTVSASVNGAAPAVSLAVDSGSTISFVEPLTPGRRPLPSLGEPLPCDASACPCDIACGFGCDLPLPAYAAGAFGPPGGGGRQSSSRKERGGPLSNSNSHRQRLLLLREGTPGGNSTGRPSNFQAYRDPVGGNAQGKRCAFDAGYADGGGVKGYIYAAAVQLGARGSGSVSSNSGKSVNGSTPASVSSSQQQLPATLVPLGATAQDSHRGPKGESTLPAPLQVADGFLGLARAPSAFPALLQRSGEVAAASGNKTSSKQPPPQAWVGPGSGHVGFCLGQPTGGAMLMGGASAADAGRTLLPRSARPAYAPLLRVKEDPWLWSVAAAGVTVLAPPLPQSRQARVSGFAASAADAVATAATSAVLPNGPPDAKVSAFAFDTGTTSALVMPDAASYANLTAALARAVQEANDRLPEGAPQRLLPHGDGCWLAAGAVATYESAVASLEAQRAADQIIKEVKEEQKNRQQQQLQQQRQLSQRTVEAAAGRRLQQQPPQQPPQSPPTIKTVLGDEGMRGHGPAPGGPGANVQRADGGGGGNGGGASPPPPGSEVGALVLGGPIPSVAGDKRASGADAGPPTAAIAVAAEKLGGLDAVDDLSLALFPDLVLELAPPAANEDAKAATGGTRGPRLRRIVVPASAYVLAPRRDRVDVDARFVDAACAVGAVSSAAAANNKERSGAAAATPSPPCSAEQRAALADLALGRYCALIASANEAQPTTAAIVGAAAMRGAAVLLDDAPGQGTLGWAHGVDCTAAFGG